MRTAVSIPDEIYRRAERLAEVTNRSRSRLYSDALREYLSRHESNAVTTRLNEALEEIDHRRDPFLTAAARSILATSEW
jgi:predicted transcriptional regulator